jgi:hypothetical protein
MVEGSKTPVLSVMELERMVDCAEPRERYARDARTWHKRYDE